MHNIKLRIAYDGKNYLGWQKTRMGPSIEEIVQVAIEQILQLSTPLQAASRTDAGVHAVGQIINFFTTHPSLDLQKFRTSLNSLLPRDIVVLDVTEMPLHFHPTLDCKGKEYRYYICHSPTQLPHNRFYSWHVHYPLDIEAIQRAIPFFLGVHSFAAFCNVRKNASYTNVKREILSLFWAPLENSRFYFQICGNHFLYKMVRNIVGTLIDIGKKKIYVHNLPDIIQQEQRKNAGVTAPAHGLFLHDVFYS